MTVFPSLSDVQVKSTGEDSQVTRRFKFSTVSFTALVCDVSLEKSELTSPAHTTASQSLFSMTLFITSKVSVRSSLSMAVLVSHGRYELMSNVLDLDELIRTAWTRKWLGETSLTEPLILSGTAMNIPLLALPLSRSSFLAGLTMQWKPGIT